MSRGKRAAKAGRAIDAVETVRENPYVQRVIEDDDLRDNLRVAYESARDAYGRLTNGQPAPKALMRDKKLQKDLREAAVALREAGTALAEGPKRRRGGAGRKLFVLVVGAGLAIALSEGLRSKVLDTLFGKEEEFDYTSTTTPAPAPGATVPA